MQSNQENVLEEFMQRSFGAQFLFVPKKYRKGTAHREPADLAWVTNDFVVLFYLRSSHESLHNQIEHNRNQAAGYHRMWSSGKPSYALRGRNRFGDECYVPYEKVPINIAMLVVSVKCAPHFSKPLTSKKPNIVLIIPELIIHWVSSFGGTIVDLLILINLYFERFGDLTPSCDQSYESIIRLTQEYVLNSLTGADPDGRYLSGRAQQDYQFIFKHLSYLKLYDSSGREMSDQKDREEVSALFGDFMLREFASIAAGAERAIHASEPPTFKKWIVLKIIGNYYSIVIGTINMGSNNVLDVTKAALEACNAGFGELESIYIQYGNISGINDYRSPLMLVIPKLLPKKHASILVEQLLEKSRI